MERAIIYPKKRTRLVTNRISRTTETALSLLCLTLFASSASLLVGVPLYFMRNWLSTLAQYEWTIFFSAYLLLLPIAFITARHSLRLLAKVEAMGGRRIPFRRRFKKLKQREKEYQPKLIVHHNFPKVTSHLQEEVRRPVTEKIVRTAYS